MCYQCREHKHSCELAQRRKYEAFNQTFLVYRAFGMQATRQNSLARLSPARLGDLEFCAIAAIDAITIAVRPSFWDLEQTPLGTDQSQTVIHLALLVVPEKTR